MNSRVRSLDDFLGLLKGVRRVGKDRWLALCPGHNDREPSLSIKEAHGRILLKCFAGCELHNILGPMGLEPRDLFLDSARSSAKHGAGGTADGKPCQPANGMPKQAQNRVDTPKLNGVKNTHGLTLAALAEAKRLPVDFLKSLGVSDFKLGGVPVVRIPYCAADGTEQAVRFRLTLATSEGPRFKWRKGDRALLYGMNRLGQIKKAGWVLIVEGESDCWTLWYHGLPALGAPGKSLWPPAWGDYLTGLDVYIWQEPGAEDFVLRVLTTAPQSHYISAPGGIKDISEAHIQGLDIPSWLDGLKIKAEYSQELKETAANVKLVAAYEAAQHVIEADDPLELIADAIRELGYGGDLKPALITYLAATSRLLEMRPGAMPVHLLLIGPSSTGKNYTLSCVLNLLPGEAYHVIDAGSPRVLIYDDAELKHKVIIFSEADSLPAGEDNPAASAIRNLLQDHHLHYVVTVRNPVTGDYVVRKVDKPGPTTLITTSTRSLGAQLITRLFTLEISDSREQIGAALETQATLETEGITSPNSGIVAFQQYLQLRAPAKVVVPYARELGAAMARMAAAPRILRDFARLVSLIKSIALIRHHHRQLDSKGRIMATIDDYGTVRELVNDMYIDSSTGATGDVRKLVETVIILDGSRAAGERITNTTLAKQLGIGLKRITRLARKAMKHGWLVNREQRKSYPADYAPGELMPGVEGLPVLHAGLTPVDTQLSTEFEAKNELVDMLTPLTDGEKPAACDSREAILDMPISRALEIWHSEGAPLIHLGPGENCQDLEKLLSLPDVDERHLQAVKQWLDRVIL